MESGSDEFASGSASTPAAPPESPQSQFYYNPDLLELMFTFFHVRTPQSESEGPPGRIPFPDSQHLLWASLASKNFLDSALNVLWRSIDSWLPLLRLISVLVIDGSNVTSNGIILEEHLQTMARYAKRVRHIRIITLRQTIPQFIYASIGQILGYQSTTLLPTLNILDIPKIGEISNDHVQCLFLLPCSTISEITIRGLGHQTSELLAASLIHSITQRNRVVKSLRLGGRITPITLNLVNRFERLETLRLDMQGTPFSREVLDKISQTTTLKRVHLTLDNSCTFPISSSPKISTFWSLQELEISSSAQIALMIFLYITTPYLNILTLHFSSLGQDTSIPGKCLQRITDIAKSLQSIQITASDVNICIPGADLACLGTCPLLEDIDIPVDYLTMQTFPVIFEQWPSVLYLKLVSKKLTARSSSQGSYESVPLGLSQLSRILALCPNLKVLHISIILDMKPAASQAMQSNPLLAYQNNAASDDHHLNELVLLPFADSRAVLDDSAAATISNAVIVSRFIDYICPYIKKCDLSKLTDIDRDWRDGVQTMVKEFQRVRNPKKYSRKGGHGKGKPSQIEPSL